MPTKQPATSGLALADIVKHCDRWLRRYHEGWFGLAPGVQSPTIPLEDAEDVRGQAYLQSAIDALLELADTAMRGHEKLVKWRDQNAKLEAKQAKKKPAKKASRRKQ